MAARDNTDQKSELISSDLDDLEFETIVDEVISAIDGVVMEGLTDLEDLPEILCAMTILHEKGVNYFGGVDDAYLYALAPCDLHPGPWVWMGRPNLKWRCYDDNNVVVGDNINSKCKFALNNYIIYATGVDRGYYHA